MDIIKPFFASSRHAKLPDANGVGVNMNMGIVETFFSTDNELIGGDEYCIEFVTTSRQKHRWIYAKKEVRDSDYVQLCAWMNTISL